MSLGQDLMPGLPTAGPVAVGLCAHGSSETPDGQEHDVGALNATQLVDDRARALAEAGARLRAGHRARSMRSALGAERHADDPEAAALFAQCERGRPARYRLSGPGWRPPSTVVSLTR